MSSDEEMQRLWAVYLTVAARFNLDPSPRAEGEVIATYAEFCRALCPEDAATLINRMCRHLKFIVDENLIGKRAA